MTSHVFIVNRDTLPLHLQFGWAGTGKPGDQAFDASMAADLARVRPGDELFFYVEREGFLGSFRATSAPCLRLPPDLRTEFGIGLPYRVYFEPSQVYAGFLPESESLDLLPDSTSDVLWTLIYRKLRGRRGCTALLPHEADILRRQLRERFGIPLPPESVAARQEGGEFVLAPSGAQVRTPYGPLGPPLLPAESVPDIVDRDGTSEATLELAACVDLTQDGLLASELGVSSSQLRFLGNQVYAGVGMQAMDVVAADADRWLIIELKWAHVYPAMVEQQRKYWVHLSRRLGQGDHQIDWVSVTKQPRRRSARMRRAHSSLHAAAAAADCRYHALEWYVADRRIAYDRLI